MSFNLMFYKVSVLLHLVLFLFSFITRTLYYTYYSVIHVGKIYIFFASKNVRGRSSCCSPTNKVL